VCAVLSVFVDMQHDAQETSTLLDPLHCSPAALQAHQNARGGNMKKIDAYVHSRCLKCSFAASFGAESVQRSAMQSLSKSRMKCAESSRALARAIVINML